MSRTESLSIMLLSLNTTNLTSGGRHLHQLKRKKLWRFHSFYICGRHFVRRSEGLSKTTMKGCSQTLWPEASKKAPMDAAKPTQIVLTSGPMCLMVSNTAIPEHHTPYSA